MSLQMLLRKGILKGGFCGIVGPVGLVIIVTTAFLIASVQQIIADLALYPVLFIALWPWVISVLVLSFFSIIPAAIIGGIWGGFIALSAHVLRNYINSPNSGILHGLFWGGLLILGLWHPILQGINQLSEVFGVIIIIIMLLSGAYTGYFACSRA